MGTPEALAVTVALARELRAAGSIAAGYRLLLAKRLITSSLSWFRRWYADSAEDPDLLAREIAQANAPRFPALALLQSGTGFLRPEHFREDPDHYARNAIYICPDGDLSLFALVWLPGHWTPVHDHGSWGVVGVVEGLLEERAYMSADGDIRADGGIRLRRGGVVLLNPGSVTTFVPNPDHVHMTGVAATRSRCVSLHLYGRNMDSFHIYDVERGTWKMINVPHYESR